MKNIDYINSVIAKKYSLNPDIIKKINSNYWNTVKAEMRSVENQSVFLKEIGTIEVSQFKINRHIAQIRTYIKNMRGSKKFTDAKKEIIINKYKERYSKCLKMRKQVDEDIQNQKNIRCLRRQQSI